MLHFDSANLTTDSVVVYSDRAEICKHISVQLTVGANEILVDKLSRSLIDDSIRVEGRGTKAVTITEVKFQEKPATKDEALKDGEEKTLNARLKRLHDDKRNAEQNLQRLKTQKDVLVALAGQLSGLDLQSNVDQSANKAPINFLEGGAKALDNLESFLNYFNKRTSNIDQSTNTIDLKIASLNEEIQIISDKLASVLQQSYSTVKQVAIIVNATEACEAVFDLFYLVYHVYWHPSYDVRVQVAEASIKITYYGAVQQSTDEDWANVRLMLSTASPKICGQVPELKTTKVNLYKPPKPKVLKRHVRKKLSARLDTSVIRFQSLSLDREEDRADSEEEDYQPAMTRSTASVQENVTSSTFEIANRTSIPCDGSEHRVTIAIIDLTTTFLYQSVPSKSTYVYLVAKSTNDSSYPLLPGPAAVFVGSNFVANTQLKAVNVKEQFEVSLGVDPSIKIEYNAPRKFNEEYGVLTRFCAVTHQQKITVQNTKKEPVQVVVTEPFLQSTDEKIKVNLIEPALNKAEKGCKAVMNKFNNLEWTVTVQPSDKCCLIMKYTTEYPKSETLEYKEEF